MQHGLAQKDIQRRLVEKILERLPHSLAIYAFGSQVQGTAHAQSDLDLAVLVGVIGLEFPKVRAMFLNFWPKTNG